MKYFSIFAFALFLTFCGGTHEEPRDGGLHATPPPTIDKDGTRIRVARLRTTTADGLQDTHNYSYYDNQLKMTCTPGLDEAGVLRCFPFNAGLINAFAEPSCGTPVTIKATDCQDAPTAHYIRSQGSDRVCNGWFLRYYKYGPQITTAYAYNRMGSCAPYPFKPGEIAFSVGEEEPNTSFAPMTQILY